jgi:hypothetical protein
MGMSSQMNGPPAQTRPPKVGKNNNKGKNIRRVNRSKKSNGGELITMPSAKTRLIKTTRPSFNNVNRSDGRIIVKHREFVSDVYGSVAFTLDTYPINPGMQITFSWLNLIAIQFESYIFKKLRFLFTTVKGTSTSGSVMMAVDYDATDDPPLNKTQIMSYHGASRSSPWSECANDSAQGNLLKFGVQRYVRGSAVNASIDLKTMDVGNFYIATKDCADASAIGELYVEYEVELITPQTNPSVIVNAFSKFIVGASSIAKNQFLGVSPTMTGGLPVLASYNTITFLHPGQFIVSVYVGGVNFTNAGSRTGTATIINLDGGNAYTELVGDDFLQSAYLVKVNNAYETLIIDYTAACTSLSASFVRIGGYTYLLG